MGLSVAPPFLLARRHSLESGNPQTNNDILAKAGTSPLREIRHESQQRHPHENGGADPFFLYGLTGGGWAVWERGRPAGGAARGAPKPSPIKGLQG